MGRTNCQQEKGEIPRSLATQTCKTFPFVTHAHNMFKKVEGQKNSIEMNRVSFEDLGRRATDDSKQKISEDCKSLVNRRNE